MRKNILLPALVLVTVTGAVLFWRHRSSTSTTVPGSDGHNEQLKAALSKSEMELAKERANREMAEADLTKLLTAVKDTGVGTAAMSPLQQYEAVWARAEASRQSGDYAAAARDLIWCYKNASVKGMFERSSVVANLRQLRTQYPGAAEPIRQLRDGEAAAALQNPNAESAQAVLFLNDALGERGQTVAFYDSLPPKSLARESIGAMVFDDLVKANRHAEAVQAKPFSSMYAEVGRIAALAQQAPNEKVRTDLWDRTVRYVEALSAANMKKEADLLASRLSGVDVPDNVRGRLAQALGQPKP